MDEEKKERRYRTLYGSMVEASKIVGYCRLHKVHLTEAQLKAKECLKKDCHALKRWDAKYWEHRERMKAIKKLKEEQGIPSWQRVQVRTDRNGNLLPKLRKQR